MGADPADFAENPSAYDIPDSVIGFLRGELGDPPGGWPEPFRKKALKGRAEAKPVAALSEEDEAILAVPGLERRERLNELLFPGPAKEFEDMVAQYGDISVLDTYHYLYGLKEGTGEEITIELDKGVDMLVALEAIGVPDEHGMRWVMFSYNGQMRPVQVRDNNAEIRVVARERADANVAGQVGAPFAGSVTAIVEEGATVAAGDAIATIEAMKMEASITAPVGGTVSRVVVKGTEPLQGGDLVMIIS
jgi:pyruvate carboxylase